jgi:hypothetical protein
VGILEEEPTLVLMHAVALVFDDARLRRPHSTDPEPGCSFDKSDLKPAEVCAEVVDIFLPRFRPIVMSKSSDKLP